jgi:stage V sporulation protein S
MTTVSTENNNEAKKKTTKGDAVLRVGSKTDVKKLAGAITATIKEHGYVYVKGIGDGAIGRSMRAVAIASGYLTPMDIELVVKASYFITEIGGQERTGLNMLCENR